MRASVGAIAFVGVAWALGSASAACGPTKPPLVPDVVEEAEGGAPDMPPAPASASPVAPAPKAIPPG